MIVHAIVIVSLDIKIEAAREILAEVFMVGLSEVKEMIENRLEKVQPGFLSARKNGEQRPQYCL